MKNEKMHSFTRVFALTVVLTLSGALSACGGNGVKTGRANPGIAFAGDAASVLSAAPGQTLDITLKVSDAGAFARGIAIVGGLGVGATPVKKKPPFNFSLTLPRTLQPGTYRLTAMGYGEHSEQALATATAILKVTLPGNTLLSLAPPPATLVFDAIGEQLPVRVTGSTADGAVELSDAPGLAYQAADAAVGSVDTHGLVTARSEGQTHITLLLNGQTVANVPVEVLKPALLPSATGLDFGTQSLGSRSGVQPLVIVNHRSYPVSILEVDTPPAYPETDDCVSSSPLAAGGSCAINIAFQPTAKGPADASVRIVDSAVSAATNVYLTGTGGD